jgi:hypothetical protein
MRTQGRAYGRRRLGVVSSAAMALLACTDAARNETETEVDASPVAMDAASAPPRDAAVEPPSDVAVGPVDAAVPDLDAARDMTRPPPRDAAPSVDAAVPSPVDAQPADAWFVETPLGPVSAFGPAARLTDLRGHNNPDVARRAGCLLFGERNGTGIGNLLALIGGVERYVQPDAEGRIQLIVLARADGWAEGAPVTTVGEVALQFFAGSQDASGGLLVEPASLRDGTWPSGSTIEFERTQVDPLGWIDTPARPFRLPLPIFPGLLLELPISGARVGGRLAVDPPGFAVRNGILTGYVVDADLRQVVTQVRDACRTESPPGICALIGGQIERPVEELYALILGFVGGLDARWVAGVPSACEADGPPETACNAVSLCLSMTLDGAEIIGVAPRP